MISNFKEILEWLGYIFALIGFLATVYKSIQSWKRLKRFSWGDVDKYTKKLIKKIAKDNYCPDIIVTIGRGGAIIGSLISGNLRQQRQKEKNIPILGVDRLYEWHDKQRVEIENKMIDYSPLKSKNVLLVAGDVMTGGTMKFIRKQICLFYITELRTACLVKGVTSVLQPDYYGKEIMTDFKMPWMYKGHNYSRDSRKPTNRSRKKST